MSSWNPLIKKPYLSSKPLLSQGLASHTEDRQLEINFNQLQEMEDHSKKLYKEVKRYEDCVFSLHKLEQKMASELSNSPLCQEDDYLRKMAEDYQSVVYQMGHTTDDLVQLSQKTVVEPVKKLTSEFAAIGAALKKRDAALTDYIKCQARLEKLLKQEKTGTNVVKMKQAEKTMKQSKDDFDSLNRLLLLELPQFHEKRIDYFQPCLQALIRSQVDYYGETTRLFTHLAVSASPAASLTPHRSDADFNDEFQRNLAAIKALSIVGS